MANQKRYWSGLDELHGTDEFKAIQENEFPAAQSVDEFLSDDRLESTHTARAARARAGAVDWGL